MGRELVRFRLPPDGLVSLSAQRGPLDVVRHADREAAFSLVHLEVPELMCDGRSACAAAPQTIVPPTIPGCFTTSQTYYQATDTIASLDAAFAVNVTRASLAARAFGATPRARRPAVREPAPHGTRR